ncbi:PQQ-dependent sugar dehydrogenase [Pontibacter sp. BT310]|uniref:PQQ-dependent sugar dehydrogenase n=1 Tax=Pontibacter populi TaxID=890055 RepID=A0ABS6X815_9BACT|nr:MULTISPECIES: PQQ-dependent sugar dehydrogenase [Pontibacter]MBJ6117300.1 PQQ-dependent sugar dehydrogenase [Pontibacter sp. BT310]MBR0569725.1 PQQ-dependent sugar dehydrogenase [Microvirga sp. STS03]MBW3364153.1 PQQ-dependent sugar dehydrogenase [Pontibacter populi]
MQLFLRLSLIFLLFVSVAGCYRMRSSNGGAEGTNLTTNRPLNPSDIELPAGYTAEVVASELTFPTDVAFDEAGQVYAIEAGYSYGEEFLEPKLIRVAPGGNKTIVATGELNGPWTGITYHNGNFYVAEGGQKTGGKILKITPEGTISSLVENLPSLGDHHTNGPTIGPDGKLYFGIGTATNSGVVGPDNYNMGWLKRNPDFHDIPCQDITITRQNFTSTHPETKQPMTTGAYQPYGTAVKDGQVIPGAIPCSGAVLRMGADGGTMELVAWGFRNPFGLAFAPNGSLYVTDNGYDERGSRSVWGVGDYLWQVQQGQWYGWPDFAGGLAFNGDRFQTPSKEAPKPILTQHPAKPPHPAATLGVHSSSNGLDFSTSASFGHTGEAFVAQFGDMAPNVGKVMAPVGFKVVRVNVGNGVVTDFAVNKGTKNAPASMLKKGGLERPVAVKFSPDGTALYIVDFGVMHVEDGKTTPQKNTGVIWKVTRTTH